MDIQRTEIPGLLVIRPRPRHDNRGWFMRTFDAGLLEPAGIRLAELVQENQSRSVRGTIRGLHLRAELREAKLVRVPYGQIFDVAVDLRPASPTFLQWKSFLLDDEQHLQLRIPAGCAHGFQALSDRAEVCYRVDAGYAPELDAGLAWNDPELAIDWPLPEVILSDRDRAAPSLAALRPQLPTWFGGYRPDDC